MPYIDTLVTVVKGNTRNKIFEVLSYLYNEVQHGNRRLNQYRISIVTTNASYGHSLKVTDPGTDKVKKKRWWEKQYASDQLYLPFQLFEPVKMIRIMLLNHGERFHLALQLNNELVPILDCYYDIYNSSSRHNYSENTIRAICVHRIEEKWIESFGGVVEESRTESSRMTEEDFNRPTARPSELLELQQPRRPDLSASLRQRLPDRYAVSREQCIRSLREALASDGLVSYPDGTIYNRMTGEPIGYDLQIRDTSQTDIFGVGQICGCVRLFSDDDGTYYNFMVNRSLTVLTEVEIVDWDWIPERDRKESNCSTTEASEPLESRIQRQNEYCLPLRTREQCERSLRRAIDGDGFAIYPDGTVFNRATRELIGHDLQTRDGRQPSLTRDGWIRGSVRLSDDSRRYLFHINQSSLSSSDVAPIEIESVDWGWAPEYDHRVLRQSTRERNARFARMYNDTIRPSANQDGMRINRYEADALATAREMEATNRDCQAS
jgi:hypothetical protein